MDGLPTSVDLNPLVGSRLLQVAFGEFQVILRFDSECSVSIEGDCAIGMFGPSKQYAQMARELCGQLGAHVILAQRTSDGGIEITFSTGEKLVVRNSNERYESFQLQLLGRLYVG